MESRLHSALSAKRELRRAVSVKSEKSCSWELVDLNNPDELELMTSSSMKNEASPEIQKLGAIIPKMSLVYKNRPQNVTNSYLM